MNRYRNLRTGAEIEIPSELISPDWQLVGDAEEEHDEEPEELDEGPEEEKSNGRGVCKRK